MHTLQCYIPEEKLQGCYLGVSDPASTLNPRIYSANAASLKWCMAVAFKATAKTSNPARKTKAPVERDLTMLDYTKRCKEISNGPRVVVIII